MKLGIEERIADFCEHLLTLKYAKDIDAYCKKELDYLYKNYKLSSTKRHLSRYRNALKTLPGKHQKRSLAIMHISKDESMELQKSYEEKIQERTSNLNIMPASKIDYFIKKALCHIERETFVGKMMGLALLTGRRGVELVKSGHFYKLADIDKAISEASQELPEYLINSRENIESSLSELGLNSSNCLLFWGQAKTNLESTMTVAQPYAIPVLGDLDTIINAVNFLREKHSKYLGMDSTQIDKAINPLLNGEKSGVKHPKNYGNDFEKADCNFKLLRKIYAAISLVRFKPVTITDSIFFSRILGHGIASKGTAAAYSYFRFESPASSTPASTTASTTEPKDYGNLKYADLRAYCKAQGVKSGKLNRDAIIEKLMASGHFPESIWVWMYECNRL